MVYINIALRESERERGGGERESALVRNSSLEVVREGKLLYCSCNSGRKRERETESFGGGGGCWERGTSYKRRKPENTREFRSVL